MQQTQRQPKVLYVGALGRGGNGFALFEAFQSLVTDIAGIDPYAGADYGSTPARLIRRAKSKLLARFAPSPADDPIMRARGFRHLWPDIDLPPAGLAQINRTVQETAESFRPDLTVMFHVHHITAETLEVCQKSGPVYVFFPDDAFAPELYTTLAAVAYRRLDGVMTTKTFNVPEFQALGIPLVIFANNSYQPSCHRPVPLSDADRARFGCDVAFVGNPIDRARMDFLSALAAARPQLKIGIWGNRWSRLENPLYWRTPARRARYLNLYRFTHGPALCEDMSKVFAASKICLGLLKQGDGKQRIRDYQTTRTVEIPACGGFMLAEYTDEQAALFREGVEAAYFRSFDDALAKIDYYVSHEAERAQIAQAGHRHCVAADYTFRHRAITLLKAYRERG